MTVEGGTESFAASHIRIAEYFVDQIEEFEKEYKRNDEYSPLPDQPKSNEQLKHEQIHDALAIHTAVSSVAYLDSHINEIYHRQIEDINDEHPLPSEEYIINESSFKNTFEKYYNIHGEDLYYMPTIEKYQSFLILADKEKFDPGTTPYQDVNTIINFRNYFIHYTTEYYMPYEEIEHIEHDLGSALQGKFELNPMTNERLPFFPDHCLSHGFAEWTVEKCKEFVVDFYKKSGLEPFPTPATLHVMNTLDSD